jgi:hypothetical protein
MMGKVSTPFKLSVGGAIPWYVETEDLTMFAKVMRAIATALSAMLKMLLGLFELPFMLFGIRGRSAMPHAPARAAAPQIEPSPATADAPEPIADPLSLAAACVLKLHRRVMRRNDWNGPDTGELPPALRTWAFGLDDGQAKEAIKAGVLGLSAHLSGEAPIPGLPPVPARAGAVRRKADPRRRRSPIEAETDGESFDYAPALI